MKTNRLGIISIKLQNQPFDHSSTKLLKEIIDKHPDKEACLFSSCVDMIIPNTVPVLHLLHAKFFVGDVIITDMVSALLCKTFPALQKIGRAHV